MQDSNSAGSFQTLLSYPAWFQEELPERSPQGISRRQMPGRLPQGSALSIVGRIRHKVLSE
jgi:hypothetical protein